MRYPDSSMTVSGGNIRSHQLDDGKWEATSSLKGVPTVIADTEREALKGMMDQVDKALKTRGNQA